METSKPIEMSEEKGTSFKIFKRGEIRRISLKNFSFGNLKERITEMFDLKDREYTLKYKDEEGDFITLSSEEEMEECIRHNKDKTINLYLIGKNDCGEIFYGIKNMHRQRATRFREFLRRNRRRIFFIIVLLLVWKKLWFFLPIFTFIFAMRQGRRGYFQNLKETLFGCNRSGSQRRSINSSSLKNQNSGFDGNFKENPAKNHPFVEKLNELETMGFTDKKRNIALLIKHKGDVTEAIQELLIE